MIKVRVSHEEPQPQPKITYPFLWRAGNNWVYLRFVSLAGGTFDMRLFAKRDSHFKIGQVTSVQLTDDEAWALRLSSEEEVILQNDN